MKNSFLAILALTFLASCVTNTKKKELVSEETVAETLAQTPLMGWNSFDCYGVYLYQEAAMENLEAFSMKLAPHGYEYFVIDAGWFGEFELKPGTKYPLEKHAKKMNFNEFGLLQPSECYFPDGLQPIIDHCHELGLKFGLHLMRGIPREVYKKDLPVKVTKYTAKQITDTTSICKWNHQNYGIDMSKPGAQEFYNSLVNQMAEWGVDLIKYDDLVPFPEEVKGVTNAIAQCGRPIVLSLSPGGDVKEDAVDFYKKGNMLRVTKDIWDEQAGIDEAFEAWRKWTGFEQPGFWIDMDMIPFGQLQIMSPKPENLTGKETKKEIAERKKKGELSNVELLAGKGWNRWCEFTKDQMYTFITLRALAASPLMMGGDLPTLDDFSLALITNKEMLACNQNGVMGKLIHEKDRIEIWKAKDKITDKYWIGVFNRNESPVTIKLTSELLKRKSDAKLYDIWNERGLRFGEEYSIEANGVLFIKS